jgi:hypothetical protein
MTNDQLRAYLDGLAALSAAHDLMLDSYGLRLCVAPPCSPGLGGYIAAPRDDGIAEIHPYGPGSGAGAAIASRDVSRLTAHQRLGLEATFLRIQHILREREP